MEEFYSQIVLIEMSLRGKQIYVIGTNREKTLEYIKNTYNVYIDSLGSVHANIGTCIIERKYNCFNETQLNEILNNTSNNEVIIYTSHKNINSIKNQINTTPNIKFIQI